MERNEDGYVAENESYPVFNIDGEMDGMSSNFFMDHVGEVLLTINSNKLYWKVLQAGNKELNPSSCFGIKLASNVETEIEISDVYAVELINWGMIHDSDRPNGGGYLLGLDSEMFRFTVHGYQRSKTNHCQCILVAYTFGHKDLQTCQVWVDRVTSFINMDDRRPKNILVFIHPLSGKGNGCRTWESVAPIFSRAKVKTKVTVTQRAGQAFDVMASIEDIELKSYDGVVSVGGDGFFNEILNGLLRSRHNAALPPAPEEIVHFVANTGTNEIEPEISNQDQDPLLQCSGSRLSSFRNGIEARSTGQNATLSFPNEHLRLGIIPAGSTDAIVICTTGTRDPITSALQIVLGKRVCLDIAQVVRWKTTTFSNDAPFVRYAASFAGYGFYGDVIKESENLRWMGPKRYDYAGTKVFLKHRSYEAEVSYVEVSEELEDPTSKNILDSGTRSFVSAEKPERVICRVNCRICSESAKTTQILTNGSSLTQYNNVRTSRWLQSKGRYLSIGAAIISNRNGRAPDGLVADAHLSDGFLHLILIKDCPRAFYLWHLTQLAKKGGNPLNFKFVEHHKTPAFTFTSCGDQSVWNLDGEVLQAHQLSAQVFRGLVSLFASGPEV
ncbi:hypothetical protein AQUCO_00200007v1 [Aquilegia coerulea]|uniref:DAGKc domain-containing protein n=2 Tax=Aquilegia coerulea TaxID=218851 RepID=A0A2G5F176_AQUCA|nr:hypothetical protein AQUCO_00200007v1 [Aquilegia coerulea]